MSAGTIIHVVAVSTGKDSTNTLGMALATEPIESLRFATCDTGNEHEAYLEYVAYLERELGIRIEILRASFEREIANKRKYVLEHWPRKGVSDANVQRAAAALVPTGNPYLDLCLWKGRFPSRTMQFCTEFLKTLPLVEYQLGFIERGEADAVWAWQGVRIDESEKRRRKFQGSGACVKSFEEVGAGVFNFRPILRQTAQDSIEAHHAMGIKPNPLYSQGFDRVGCFPCVNEDKDGVLNISKRYPHHIDRIEYWEQCVASASKGDEATFFSSPDREAHLDKRGIRKVVEWSKTTRGGQKMDWIRINEEPKVCESAYGLCE